MNLQVIPEFLGSNEHEFRLRVYMNNDIDVILVNAYLDMYVIPTHNSVNST